MHSVLKLQGFSPPTTHIRCNHVYDAVEKGIFSERRLPYTLHNHKGVPIFKTGYPQRNAEDASIQVMEILLCYKIKAWHMKRLQSHGGQK